MLGVTIYNAYGNVQTTLMVIFINFNCCNCLVLLYEIGSEKRDYFATKIIFELSMLSERTFWELQNGP